MNFGRHKQSLLLKDERKQKPSPKQGVVAVDDHLAQGDLSSGGGIRTPDTRIMIPPVGREIPEEYGASEDSAARGAAVGAENKHAQAADGSRTEQTRATLSDALDPNLDEVIDRWNELPEVVRLAVLAVVRSAPK